MPTRTSHTQSIVCSVTTALLVTAMLGTAAAAFGDDSEFGNNHDKAVKGNPQGVSFSVELVEQRAKFRVGELIPLDLVYRFDKSSNYLINEDMSLASGTMKLLEVFRVSPTAGSRPGTQSEPRVESWFGKPTTARTTGAYRYRVYLNEWLRIDKPGRYRVYSQSARVWKPADYPTRDNTLRATSNLFEVEILPANVEWQADQLRNAVAVLNRPNDKTRELRVERRNALRQLRFLDTKAATRELAIRHEGATVEEGFEIAQGLLKSRYTSDAVEVFEQRMARPDFVVTSMFLVELSLLAAQARIPINTRQFSDDAASRAKLAQLRKRKRALQEKLLADYAEVAWSKAANKLPLVKSRTLLELFRFTYGNLYRDRISVPPSRLALVRSALADAFDQLPARDQIRLLETQWKWLGGVEFLPALRKFIQVAPERDIADGAAVPLDWVLLRIHELAPKEGRSLILAEMQRETPRATQLSLERLPPRPIPALDDVLASRLEESLRGPGRHDGELAAALVARYGSPAIYDRVRKVYGDRGGSWACAVQASMLGYFLRHNAEQGSQLINQAIDAREQTGCFRNVLTDVATTFMSPALENIAIRRLNDDDLNVAMSAVSVLKQHGSEAGERALWKRFKKWHKKWADRPFQLAAAQDGSATYLERRLEGSLVTALAVGTNWITPRKKLARLLKLCVSEQSRTRVTGMMEQWDVIAIRFAPGSDSEFASSRIPESTFSRYGLPDNDTWFVAQYRATSKAELKKLLSRLPTGTTLSFPTGILTDADAEQQLFAELSSHAITHGLKLLKSGAESEIRER